MTRGIPFDPAVGINPQLTRCHVCGENDGGIALVGRSTVTTCGDCREKIVHYLGQRPSRCPACRGRLVKSEQYNPDVHGSLSGGTCNRCQNWLNTGVIVRCSGCHHIYEFKGAYRMLVEMAAAEQQSYMLEDGSDFDFPRLVADGKAELVTGRVMPTNRCHFCDPSRPKPKETS